MADENRSVWERLDDLPNLDEKPIDEDWWQRRARHEEAAATPSDAAATSVAPPVAPAPAPERPIAEPQQPRQPQQPPQPPQQQPPRRRRRRRWPWVLGIVILLIVGAIVALVLYAWSAFGGVERLDLDDVLSANTGSGTNYLIVGTDSREGITEDTPNAGAIIGEPVSGERTDTIIVLRISDQGNLLMALPRDLLVGDQRINAAYANGGPASLISTVTTQIGIPIHHYMEVDLAGFLGVIDALGGITVDFENPAFDTKSGLNVAEAGAVQLDADQALAYVRSRAYTEIVDGQEITDPTGDLGRVDRQQAFLQSTFDKVSSTRNPITAVRIVDGLAGNFRMDDNIGLWDAVSLARKLGGLNPETVVLPVDPFTTSSGAAVLVPGAGAGEAIARFQG